MATVTGSPGRLSHRQPVVSTPARKMSCIRRPVGQPHLAGAIDQSWQQSQQHREVPWLVQHVSGDHPVPGRPGKQRPGLVECAHGGLQRHYRVVERCATTRTRGTGPRERTFYPA
jgi:hypothetical protein